MAGRSSLMRLAACLAIVVGAALVTPQAASAGGKVPVPHTDGSPVTSKRMTVSGTVHAAASGTKASSMSAGYAHSCAVTTTGKVPCWGYNTVGQLGDGTTTARLVPGAVLYDDDPVFRGGFEAPAVP